MGGTVMMVERDPFEDDAADAMDAKCEEHDGVRRGIREAVEERGVWVKRGNGYLAAEDARPDLPAGMYNVHPTETGMYFNPLADAGDDLLEWPGSVVSKVVADIRKFSERLPVFRKLGLTHKRGMLLFGPPGSGKTSVLRAVAREFIASGGIVLLDPDPNTVAAGLQVIRRTEAERPVLVLFEDFDTLIKRSTGTLLSLLDGEQQVDRVVFLATTNYPEKLEPRIVNRPSRFDVLIKVEMPDAEGRRTFLRLRAPELFEVEDLEKWVSETEGFSMAHLKELIISVQALDVAFETALKRLRDMLANKSIVPDPERPGQFL